MMFWRLIVAGLTLLLGRGRRRAALSPGRPRPRIVPPGPPSPHAETLVLSCLLLATVAAIGFIAVFALDRLPAQTQLLGIALGLAFAFLAVATVVTGKRLVANDEISEPYPEPANEEAREEIEQIVSESTDRFTRKRLLVVAAGGAGTALGAALVVPAVSLGPLLDTRALKRSPWQAGVRLVDSLGRPLLADEIEPESLYTAFPAGAEQNQVGSPLVVVRLEPSRLDLPPERHGWAPGGIVAYSKICTHAGCAVSLYRAPLYDPTSPRPALVCPCHYSTFDPATGGGVLFGPAGRPLPQLPVRVDAHGRLVAGGGFSGSVGPSWAGVRTR